MKIIIHTVVYGLHVQFWPTLTHTTYANKAIAIRLKNLHKTKYQS
jgi:hypothetical protein